MKIKMLLQKVKAVVTRKRHGGLGAIIATVGIAVLCLAIIAASQEPITTFVTTMITELTKEAKGILGI